MVTTEVTTRQRRQSSREWGKLSAKFAVPGLLILLVLVFSLLRPETFATAANAETILVESAVLTMLSLAVMLPLIVDEFDLSLAAVLGMSAMLAAGLPARQGFSVTATLAAIVIMALAVGAIHALLIVKFNLPSFVVTLGTNSVLAGLILFYSGGAVVFEAIPDGIRIIGTASVAGIGLPILLTAAITALLWFMLTQRPIGRLFYAVGANEPAARLAGVPTAKIRTVALLGAPVLAAIAGLVLTARVGSANPTSYSAFFLPAFAAAFLSLAAIQIGKFNPLGVVASVYLLAVGVAGLAQLGVPSWVDPVFNGAALVIAIALSRLTSNRRSARAV